MSRNLVLQAIVMSALLPTSVSCGGEDADSLGVGAECTANDQCDEEGGQQCLAEFKGGYCGIEACVGDEDCPANSACVAHDDGINYCFRICIDKSDCNENRTAENEANCSSNITFVDPQEGGVKACVPPSG